MEEYENSTVCDLVILFDGGTPYTMAGLPLEAAADLLDMTLCGNRGKRWDEEHELHSIFVDTTKVMLAYITNIRELENAVE